MMGVQVKPPPPVISDDPFPKFNIIDASIKGINAKYSASHDPANAEFFPVDPIPDTDPKPAKDQYTVVHDAWGNPIWGTGDDGRAGFVSRWADAFGWGKAMDGLSDLLKKLDNQFFNLYVAAPLLTK